MQIQNKYTNAKGNEGQALRHSSPRRNSGQAGQVMLISVIMLGGILLSAAGIAGLLTVYQIRAGNDVVNSAKAIFAADAGIEAVSWCSFKLCPWGDFTDAPFSFDDSPAVTFIVKRKDITPTKLQIISEGRAAGGKVIRILEAIFETLAP